MTTTRREPTIGAVTRSNIAARLRSAELAPGFIAPEVALKTARRQPFSGGGPCFGPSIASSVNAAAVKESGGRAGSNGGSAAGVVSGVVVGSSCWMFDVISAPVGVAADL
jgi:hypothetical protein